MIVIHNTFSKAALSHNRGTGFVLSRLLLALLLLVGSGHNASAQGSLSQCEIGVTVGGMSYLGELNDQSMFGHVSLGYGGLFRYNIDDRWSVMVSGNYGHVEAGNPRGEAGLNGDVDPMRNLSFLSYIAEGSARLEFNFFNFGTAGTQYHWTPYIFGGLGFFTFNPTTLYTDPISGNQQWVDLQPLGTEGQGTPEYPDRTKYTLIQVMMPFGIGFKAKPNKLLAFSIEYGFRKTWTDYLDDVSLTYVGADLLNQYHSDGMAANLADRSTERVNAPGIKRGDDSLNDWYAYLSASVTFRLDKLLWWVGKKKCDNKNYRSK